jgi:hypothetical protein
MTLISTIEIFLSVNQNQTFEHERQEFNRQAAS